MTLFKDVFLFSAYGCLSAWVSVYHMHEWCQRRWEEGVRVLGTRVIDDWAAVWVLETERGFSARTANALTAVPSLLPQTWHFRWVRWWDYQDKRICTVTSHVCHEVSDGSPWAAESVSAAFSGGSWSCWPIPRSQGPWITREKPLWFPKWLWWVLLHLLSSPQAFLI